jgi:hypothetical protein
MQRTTEPRPEYLKSSTLISTRASSGIAMSASNNIPYVETLIPFAEVCIAPQLFAVQETLTPEAKLRRSCIRRSLRLLIFNAVSAEAALTLNQI